MGIRVVKAVIFSCPDCKVRPNVEGAGITRSGTMFIVGKCPQCNEGVAMNIDTIIKELSSELYGRGN